MPKIVIHKTFAQLRAETTGDPLADDMLNPWEVARILGVHRESVRRWCRLGAIPFVRLPSPKPGMGKMRIRRAVVEAIANGGLT